MLTNAIHGLMRIRSWQVMREREGGEEKGRGRGRMEKKGKGGKGGGNEREEDMEGVPLTSPQL